MENGQNKDDVSALLSLGLGAKGSAVAESLEKHGLVKFTEPQQQTPPAGNQQTPPAGNQQQQAPAGNQQNPPAGNQNPPPPAGTQQQQTPAGTQQAAPSGNEQQSAEEFIQTPLGKIPIKGQQQAAAPVEPPKSFDEMFKSEHVSKAFGREFKDVGEFYEKGIPQINEWRAQASQAGDFKKKYENVEADFKALPDKARNALAATFESLRAGTNDWEKLYNNGDALDFSKPADKQDPKVLVNTYFPNKFTAEELSDPENKGVQSTIEAASSLYTKDQKDRVHQANERVREAQQKKEAVSASLNSTFEQLSSQLPFPVDEAKVTTLRQKMESGTWMEDLKNPDGTWKPNAAAGLLMVTDGPQTINEIATFVSNRAKSQSNEEMVMRGAQVNVSGNGEQKVDKKAEEVKKDQDLLVGMVTRKNHY